VTLHFVFYEQVLSFSRRQIASILATTTTGAESISAASCPQGASFYRKLADELGSRQIKPIILWEDNNGRLNLASRASIKSEASNCFWLISDYVDYGLLEPRHVGSKDQLSGGPFDWTTDT
jgi:hypothetical protein